MEVIHIARLEDDSGILVTYHLTLEEFEEYKQQAILLQEKMDKEGETE